MASLLRWIIGLTITAALAALAVMNRAQIVLYWSPLHAALSLPLYLIILGSIGFGFIFGAVVVWLNMAELRRAKRSQKKEIKTLKQEVSKLSEEVHTAPPGKELFMVLPPKI
jgi:uncharacterized integral membrane protein